MLIEFEVLSTNQCEMIDVDKKVRKIVAKSDISYGLCTVFVPHATCAVMINENYDPNICDDIHNVLKSLIPEGVHKHDKIDGNGAAHIKSSIIGPSESIPIKEGKLMLGTWQSIMVAEFDGPKKRKVYVNIVGD